MAILKIDEAGAVNFEIIGFQGNVEKMKGSNSSETYSPSK